MNNSFCLRLTNEITLIRLSDGEVMGEVMGAVRGVISGRTHPEAEVAARGGDRLLAAEQLGAVDVEAGAVGRPVGTASTTCTTSGTICTPKCTTGTTTCTTSGTTTRNRTKSVGDSENTT